VPILDEAGFAELLATGRVPGGEEPGAEEAVAEEPEG
jgi:hypothetical protein